jgi:hypothetical protein
LSFTSIDKKGREKRREKNSGKKLMGEEKTMGWRVKWTR